MPRVTTGDGAQLVPMELRVCWIPVMRMIYGIAAFHCTDKFTNNFSNAYDNHRITVLAGV